jgi:hypothetical protein
MSATAVRAAALAAVFAASGCVVYTSSGPSSGTPSTRPQPRRPRPAPRAHRPAPPTVARPAPVPVPAPPPSEPPSEPPSSRDRPVLLPDGIAAGRPGGFRPGAAAAYWIWQGPRGDWLVRTTTGGEPHAFRGRIHGTAGGTIDAQSLRSSRRELGDRVRASDGALVFSFDTAGHADGFTFATVGGGCVRFDLQLDGGATPKRIWIGKAQHEPASAHFIVCPKGRAP